MPVLLRVCQEHVPNKGSTCRSVSFALVFYLMYKTNTQCTCQLKLVCVFVGKVAIRKEDLYKYCGKENWFHLQPVDPNSEVQVSEQLDGIEVIIQHTNTHPTEQYMNTQPYFPSVVSLQSWFEPIG